MLKVDLDRIEGSVALAGLRSENVSVDGEKASVELRLSAEHDIEIHFPAPGGVVSKEWLELASDVLTHLAEMDNEVQRGGAKECVSSGYHSQNYESLLAYITLDGPDAVVLHYFGAVVNTEWDEHFVLLNGCWRMDESN